MGMTLAVYRIDPKTGNRITVRKRYNVAPGRVPDSTRGALPPCTCKRCHNTARTGAS